MGYPWFEAWGLPFHAVALAGVDVDFAKAQLELMLGAAYLHPSGQIPASEWNFSNVDPPVHAWATVFLHRTEQMLHRRSDSDFLKRMFARLLPHYTWWVSRSDRFGKNVFEGGFLGLDNIGVLDRSAALPTGGPIEQADATMWMALFCQNMLEIGIEVASADPTFEELAATFIDHFLGMATAITRVGGIGMWDEEDGFYYDVLRLPNGATRRLKVRLIVGLLPLCATTIVQTQKLNRMPRLDAHFEQAIRRQPELHDDVHPTDESYRSHHGRRMLGLVNRKRLRRMLARMLDEREFLSPFGIRTLSRIHGAHPYVLRAGAKDYCINYRAGESDTPMFAGNSSWRGPIWVPMNVTADSGAIAVVRVLRRQIHRRMPDGLRTDDEPLRSRQRDLFAPYTHLSPRRERPTARLRRHREIPGRPELARLFALLPVFQRR